MECSDIKEHLLDLLLEKLNEDDARSVQFHLEGCSICRKNFEDLKKTVALLNDSKASEQPLHLKEKIISEIKSRGLDEPVAWFWRLRDILFRPYHIKIPLGGAALLIIVLVLLFSFRNGTGTDQIAKSSEPDRSVGTPPITAGLLLSGQPVEIETRDLEEAFDRLLEIIRSQNGQLIEKREIDSGMEVIFKVEESAEKEIFEQLAQLGDLSGLQEKRKDNEGNIVVFLR